MESHIDLLNVDIIKNNLDVLNIDLFILEQIDSTNVFLNKTINKKNNIQVCIAETQKNGKGKLNRK
ncbi:MAG: hypothetical protein LEGION0398_MBIBDBAK_01451 [Legionellaceae bacterium]